MDRRQSPRQAIGEAIRATVLGLSAERNRVLGHCRVIDLSAGGLRIELHEPLPLDAAIRIDLEGRSLLGEVRYCLPGEEPGVHVAGVALCQSFIHLPELAELARLLAGGDVAVIERRGATTSPSRSGT
jgi:hypothetical protein